MITTNTQNKLYLLAGIFLLFAIPCWVNAQRYDVTFESLLNEMTDRSVVTKKPVYPYKTLQSSSYNRASVSPSDPAGWFANNDQGYDLRKEVNHGRLESVLMECDGPGVLTRIWTPFFYKDFNNRKGPDILIYLDGDEEPSIRANFIELVTGKSFVSPPFAGYTCRAGDLYLPVSFGKSCKVSVEGDAYFYIINYRKYDRQVSVETFRPELMAKYKPLLEKAGRELKNPAPFTKGKKVSFAKTITNKQAETVTLPEGSAAIRNVEFKLSAADISRALRSTVLEMIFDDKTTVWCPLGDFFGNVNGIDPYRTWEREVKADGTMICRWIMPYKKQGLIRIHNLHESPVELSINAVVSPWKWTDDTYYFHACWTTEGPYMANPVRDMNFVEVEGEGIHVGDNFVVLNPLPWWWGEGDEKIYVDEDFDRNFPSHFGTGTEDYYGWAGGEHPSREDEFSSPFLANIRVGGETRGFTGERPHTRGYNICTRSRSLDAIPFAKHFKLDIEAFNFSSGPDAILQYALTSVWYGKGDAVHNRTPLVAEASAPVPQIEDLEKITRTSAFRRKGAIECEDLKIQSLSDNLAYEIETTKNDNDENKWSMNKQLLVRAKQNGAFLSFLLQEQYHPKKMILYMTSAPTYGKVNIYVNNRPVKAEWDGYSPVAKICEIDLGKQEPLNNTFEIKIEVTGKHGASSDYHFGLDCLLLQDN